MDQIFDRLERLVKAWVSSTAEQAPFVGRARGRASSGDPDYDAAMAELDEFLNPTETETEARERREREARAERERRERERQRAGAGSYSQGPSTKAVVEDAYRYLGLAPYTDFPTVKTTYRKLLLKHHPDRHGSGGEEARKATETSAKINAAYQIIEAWEESKRAAGARP